jgi:hypothetical protein
MWPGIYAAAPTGRPALLAPIAWTVSVWFERGDGVELR